MTSTDEGMPRRAIRTDIDALLPLWGLLFDEEESTPAQPWRRHARTWFDGVVDDDRSACFPVIESAGEIVATAIGTLELGVPNPQCPHGRAVRLANVVTAAEHRGHGYGSTLVDYVVDWANSVHADRVDLSATPAGQRLYARAGFVLASAPRMKRVL